MPASRSPLSPQLSTLLDEIEAIDVRASQLVDGLQPGEWERRPSPKSWSAAECLIHLNLTAEQMLPRLTAAVGAALEAGYTGDGPFKSGFLGGLLAWLIEPPYQSRFATTKPFEPAAIAPPEKVLAVFREGNAALSRIIQDATGVDLNRTRFVSPFNEKVTYTAYAAMRIVNAHSRRHLWQAERALAALRAGARR